MEPTPTQLALQTLRQRQSLPLEAKVQMSLLRIRQWYEHWDGMVYVAFSGGKDSTALLHLVRPIYPDVPAVFCDTGLEYPEIRDFVKTFENVVWLKPKMSFRTVLEKYGYPVPSKMVADYVAAVGRCQGLTHTLRLRITGVTSKGVYHPKNKIPNKWLPLCNAPFAVSGKCCDIMKKRPSKQYDKDSGRAPYIGMMASDSWARQAGYLKTGCNSLVEGRVQSNPIAFWLEKDVWAYIRSRRLPYSRIYDMGETRTGCMFCMFGIGMEASPNRFQRMQHTHPKQWKFCMEQLGLREVLEYIGIPWKCPTAFWDWDELTKTEEAN